MNFCHVINDRYVNNLIVLMSSIFENCKGDHCFYILSNGLKNENEKKIQQFAEKNFSKVFLIMVDDSCLKNVPLKRKDFDKTPYYKLLLPLLLPENVNRILYMDVDMIVLKDLTALYMVDFNGAALAAVPDPLVNTRDLNYLKKMQVNLQKGQRYFNSGLILFNIELMRSIYCLEDALNYIEKNGSTFKFHDQEVLNGLFLNNYKQLPEIYNYLTVYRSIPDLLHYLMKIKKDILPNIVVLHYANPTKPWKKNYIGKYEEYFWKYAKVSPIYDNIRINEKNSIVEQVKALYNTLKRKIIK